MYCLFWAVQCALIDPLNKKLSFVGHEINLVVLRQDTNERNRKNVHVNNPSSQMASYLIISHLA